ncbi:MAG: hypothetical protein ACFFCO_06310 [Promethearchaeota archaeon]
MYKSATVSRYTKSWLPLTFRIALLVIFAALGVVLRQLAIPTWTLYVTLTPGFTMPLLTGMVLGPVEGIVCGLMVGISGAFAPIPEPVLIPIIGNIALGLSTGLPALIRERIPRPLFIAICLVSASLIGGFLPTFGVETLVFLEHPFGAAIIASLDAVQATIWVVVALFLDMGVIQPIIRRVFEPLP